MAKPFTQEQEITALRQLVKAQDALLVAYRLGSRPPFSAIDKITRLKAKLAASTPTSGGTNDADS